MMRHTIPDSKIQEVLNSTSIVDVIGRYVQLSRNGRYWKGLCPFHGEKTPSFTVTPDKHIFHCFGCKKGGDAFHFLMEIEGWTYVEAVRYLAEQAQIPLGDDFTDEPETEVDRNRRSMREAHTVARNFYHFLFLHTKEAAKAREYALQRGFTQAQVEEFQLGYAPSERDALVNLLSDKKFDLTIMEQAGLVMRTDNGQWVDRFRDRLMFPITDGQGHTVGFGGRMLGDGQPKYLNSSESPVFHKGRILYRFAESRVQMKSTKEAVLFEGYVDVVRAWSVGVKNGVASLGTALTQEQVALLKKMVERVTICYDGDEAGQQATEKAVSLLRKNGVRVRVANLPNDHDPDSYILNYGAESFLTDVLAKASSVPAYVLKRLQLRYQIHEQEGKSAYLDAACKYLAKSTLPSERELLINDLATKMGVTAKSIFDQVALYLQDQPNSTYPTSSNRNDAVNMSAPKRNQQFQGRFDSFSKNRNGNPKGFLKANQKANPLDDVSEKAFSIQEVHSEKVDRDYEKAENHLILQMLTNPQFTQYVQGEIGEEFNDETNNAIAAYLYAYYSSENPVDTNLFMDYLADERLKSKVRALLSSEFPELNDQALADYIRAIRKGNLENQIKRLEDEIETFKRAGDMKSVFERTTLLISLERQRTQR